MKVLCARFGEEGPSLSDIEKRCDSLVVVVPLWLTLPHNEIMEFLVIFTIFFAVHRPAETQHEKKCSAIGKQSKFNYFFFNK